MRLDIAAVDDGEELNALVEQIGAVCSEMGVEAMVFPFSSGEAFLSANRARGFDIAFMDVYMKGMNGIETVRSISANTPCRFVFMTVSTEHAIEAFALNAAHYLIKPATDEAIGEALRRCMPSDREKDGNTLEVRTGRFTARVLVNEILFIEVMDKFCAIHTKKERFDTHITLGALYEQLDKNVFIRAQRSFVVNMNYIDSFFFDRIVLKNGKEISLSRNNRAELREHYQSFLFRLARGSDA